MFREDICVRIQHLPVHMERWSHHRIHLRYLRYIIWKHRKALLFHPVHPVRFPDRSLRSSRQHRNQMFLLTMAVVSRPPEYAKTTFSFMIVFLLKLDFIIFLICKNFLRYPFAESKWIGREFSALFLNKCGNFWLKFLNKYSIRNKLISCDSA